MASNMNLPELTRQQMKDIKENRAVNRRRFMAGLGMTGAAVAGASLLSGCSDNGTSTTVVAAGPSQADVLNFALNLEYLEATFYYYLVTGGDLPSAVTTGSGPVTNASMVTPITTSAGVSGKITVSAQVFDMMSEIAFDEYSHVADLRTALGSGAVARPALNLGALGTVTATNVFTFARALEDTGVTAYAGAASLLTGTNLTYAAQILAVEGFHSGALRLLAIQAGNQTALTLDSQDVKYADPGTGVLTAGPTTATGGFFATAGSANASATVFPGFAYTRTTSQVLAIVYATAVTGTAKGGFYPAGLNGNITTI